MSTDNAKPDTFHLDTSPGYQLGMGLTILSSVIAFALNTDPDLTPSQHSHCQMVTTISMLIFAVDTIARATAHPPFLITLFPSSTSFSWATLDSEIHSAKAGSSKR